MCNCGAQINDNSMLTLRTYSIWTAYGLEEVNREITLSNILVNTSVCSGNSIKTELVTGEYTPAGDKLAAQERKAQL